MSTRTTPQPAGFLPGLAVGDAVAAFWLGQVVLRLRREMAWLWRERGWTGEERPPADGLPPFSDRAAGVLDLERYAAQKATFFQQDECAAYLTQKLSDTLPPVLSPPPARGSFGWVASALHLAPVECFALALAVQPVVDSAAGSVFAACLNDAARTQPTLALLQRLWDEPAEALGLFDPAHVLYRYGLLQPVPNTWDSPLTVPGIVARQLLLPTAPTSAAFRPVTEKLETLDDSGLAAAVRLRSPALNARVLPIIGGRGASLEAVAHRIARAAGLSLEAVAQPGIPLAPLATVSWLRGSAIFLPWEWLTVQDAHDGPTVAPPLPGLPVTWFLGLRDRSSLKRLAPQGQSQPVIVNEIPHERRVSEWTAHLPGQAHCPELQSAIVEIARRFRHGPETIRGLCEQLRHLGQPPRPADVLRLCRADLDFGELAQRVVPRFAVDELMLAPKHAAQIRAIIHAMEQLATVHYEWGTARPWSESGLTALFAGSPGTGKTMAVEAIATALGLPLFRIDLSQVVNKYIGETEKNLRRVFDTADESDVILFFDEADSLFGKRTEVKDSHDRYANLEVSYLLERMERFKGLAVLATNRKSDLDEAFLRRLRFLVDFELPGLEERRRIWESVLPPGADASGADLALMAARFPVSGGHIRSIVFNACLAAARPGAERILTTHDLLEAARAEYDKLGRTVTPEIFTPPV